LKISFISIFPDFIDSFKQHSIVRKAIKEERIEIENVNLRDFSTKKKKHVDDYIYGGGPGMLLLIEPVVNAIESVKQENSHVILLGPRGKRFNQSKAVELSTKQEHIILICGHYEGIDSRIKHYIDEELSIGDFIITGGEMAAMIVADAIIRLIPGVIKQDSIESETFDKNRIEYDQYSKPIDFRGYKVPSVLTSGNHGLIREWKKRNAIENTIDYIYKRKPNKEGEDGN